MAFIGSSVSFANDSYTEYFSEEREFVVVDNALDSITYLYSDENTGYLYSHNIDTKEEKLIFEQNVTNYYVWNEHIYCVVNGKSIVKITVKGENPETILTASKDIEQLYVNDDLIFYLSNNSIYRYHRESQTTDRMVRDDYIYFFYPYSNFVIEWNTLNNLSSVKSLNYYAETINYLYRFSFEKNISTTETRSSAVYIHGKVIPNSKYPSGSYYSQNGSACSCHDENTCSTSVNSCNCKSYTGLDGKTKYQCRAFAAEMYNYIWSSSMYSVKNSTARNVNSSSAALNYIRSLSTGTLVDATTIYGAHAFILVDFSDTDVTIYEANWPGNCKVRYISMSYADFAKIYTKFTTTYIGNHSYASTYYYNNRYHWNNCSLSKCNGSSPYTLHSFSNVNGVEKCVCGYSVSTTKGVK